MRFALFFCLLWVLSGCRSPEPAADPTVSVTAISLVQGSAARSPLEGSQVTVEGVVTADFSDGLGGVFLQALGDDGDPATSEGLFLARAEGAAPPVQVGDVVRVTGTVHEDGEGDATLTVLREIALERIGQATPEPLVLTAAPASAADWERLEGRLLTIDAPLTVTGNDGLARFGELLVSFGGRLYVPTELYPPGPQAQALAADNARQMLRLDDGSNRQNPPAPALLAGGWDDSQPLRTGSEVAGVQGVLEQRYGSYRLQLTRPLAVASQAPRPAAPRVDGDRRIAGFNVLNLFNGDGAGGGFPTERGAASAEQHARQQAKLVLSVQALDPDVAALMELENDGIGPDSALAQFVDALNAAGPHQDWRFVAPSEGPGTDSIRVGIIYRHGRVSPVGGPATTLAGPFANRSRAPLAQAFRAGSGPVFVVVANHFKSKGGCDRASGADADLGDGQACFNATRVDSAQALHDWLATDPTGTRPEGTLVIGDLNAHAQEDPMRLLYALGWRDAFAITGAARPYSYVWAGQSGRLDHALLDAGLAARLRGAVEWHSNADESTRFDYRDDDGRDPWRASDHDPLLLGLDLTR
jgi:predicted extracellular nuclease